jgi:hypothetical protein
MSYQDGDDEAATLQPRVRYEGEDISPTTTRELNGWYAYPIAAEVFAVVAVGSYRYMFIAIDDIDVHQAPSSQYALSNLLERTGTSSLTGRNHASSIPEVSGCVQTMVQQTARKSSA